jgi:hypothetical protein
MRTSHEWYYLACVCDLQFIKGHIPEAVFKTSPYKIDVDHEDVTQVIL